MRYKHIVEGKLILKRNRFIVICEVEGRREEVHLKNTGRLENLLLEGNKVYLEESMNPKRKTKYDLISVVDPYLGIVNIDSQANNTIMKEWLSLQDYDLIKSEYSYGNSRFDFYMEKDHEKYYLEVKGCTMEKEGIGLFPDAISKRASKHLRELIELTKQGNHCIIAFVIGMPGIDHVIPYKLDQEFVETFALAKKAGIEVWYMVTYTSKDEYRILKRS